MPIFVFTSPEGEEFEIEGPAEASPEQAFQILQAQLAAGNVSDAPPGTGETIMQGAADLGSYLARVPGAVADVARDAGQGLSGLAGRGQAIIDYVDTPQLEGIDAVSTAAPMITGYNKQDVLQSLREAGQDMGLTPSREEVMGSLPAKLGGSVLSGGSSILKYLGELGSVPGLDLAYLDATGQGTPEGIASLMANLGTAGVDKGQRIAEEATPPGAEYLNIMSPEKALMGGVESVGTILPALGTGLVTPKAVLPSIFASTTGRALNDIQKEAALAEALGKAGPSEMRQWLVANLKGGVEAGTEMIPMKRLFSSWSKDWAKQAAKFVMEETGQEVTAEVLDAGIDKFIGTNPEMTLGEFSDRMKGMIAQLPVAVGGTLAAGKGIHAAGSKLEQMAADVAFDKASKAAAEETARRSLEPAQPPAKPAEGIEPTTVKQPAATGPYAQTTQAKSDTAGPADVAASVPDGPGVAVPPVVEPPVVEPPKTEPPKAEPPKAEQPQERATRLHAEGLPIDDEGKVTLVHYSKQAGLTELDPAYYGKGIRGAEARRKLENPETWADRTHFGVKGAYTKETALGNNQYETKVPATQIYDLQADPLNLKDQARFESGALDFTRYEKLVREAGFTAAWVQQGDNKVVVKFDKTPVAPVAPAPAVAAPGVAAPAVAAPGVAAPAVAAPVAPAPAVAAPGVAAPGVAAPGVAAPDTPVAAPGVAEQVATLRERAAKILERTVHAENSEARLREVAEARVLQKQADELERRGSVAAPTAPAPAAPKAGTPGTAATAPAPAPKAPAPPMGRAAIASTSRALEGMPFMTVPSTRASGDVENVLTEQAPGRVTTHVAKSKYRGRVGGRLERAAITRALHSLESRGMPFVYTAQHIKGFYILHGQAKAHGAHYLLDPQYFAGNGSAIGISSAIMTKQRESTEQGQHSIAFVVAHEIAHAVDKGPRTEADSEVPYRSVRSPLFDMNTGEVMLELIAAWENDWAGLHSILQYPFHGKLNKYYDSGLDPARAVVLKQEAFAQLWAVFYTHGADSTARQALRGFIPESIKFMEELHNAITNGNQDVRDVERRISSAFRIDAPTEQRGPTVRPGGVDTKVQKSAAEGEAGPGPGRDTDAGVRGEREPVEQVDEMAAYLPGGSVVRIESHLENMVRTRAFFNSATDVLRRQPELVHLADAVERRFDLSSSLLGGMADILRIAEEPFSGLFKKAKREAAHQVFRDYFQHRENHRPGMAQDVYDNATPEEQALIDAWLQVANETGQKLVDIGQQVFDPQLGSGGQWRPLRKVDLFFPRTFKPEVLEALNNPEKYLDLVEQIQDALVAAGIVADTPEGRASAITKIRSEVNRVSSSGYFAGTERARTTQWPEMLYDYAWDAATSYVMRWADRTAQIMALGQKGPSKDLFEQMEPRVDRRTAKYLALVSDSVYSVKPTSAASEWIQNASTIFSAVALGSGPATITNLIGGTMFNIATHGVTPALKTLIPLVKDFHTSVNEAKQKGVLLHDMLQLEHDRIMFGGSAAVTAAATKALTYSGFLPAETVVRTHAMLIGKANLRQMLDAFNRNIESNKSQKALAILQRHRFDYKKLVAENGIGPETDRYLRWTSNIAQGSYTAAGHPAIMDTSLMRFAAKFLKWSTGASRNFTMNFATPFFDSITKGGESVTYEVGGTSRTKRVRAFMPMIRYLGVLGSSGYFLMLPIMGALGLSDDSPDLDEIEKLLQDDEFADAAGLAATAVWDGLITSSFIGVVGIPIEYVTSIYRGDRVHNPFFAPTRVLEAFGNMIKRWGEEGALTARNLQEWVEATVPVTRNVRRNIVAPIADEMGSDMGLIEAWRQDKRDLDRRKGRFARETGLVRRGRAPDRAPKNENTITNQKIVEAIIAGRPEQAKAILEASLAEATTFKESSSIKMSAISAVRGRSPFNVYEEASSGATIKFRKWLKANSGEAQYLLYTRMQDAYVTTAIAAGLMSMKAPMDDVKAEMEWDEAHKKRDPSTIKAKRELGDVQKLMRDLKRF